MPDHGIEPIGTDAPGGAGMRPSTRQGSMPFAFIVEILVFFADAPLPGAHQAQAAFPTLHQPAQQIAARSGLIHLVSQYGVALSWHLRFVKQLGGDNGGGGGPHPPPLPSREGGGGGGVGGGGPL